MCGLELVGQSLGSVDGCRCHVVFGKRGMCGEWVVICLGGGVAAREVGSSWEYETLASSD
jgi:hypothetical protein